MEAGCEAFCSRQPAAITVFAGETLSIEAKRH